MHKSIILWRFLLDTTAAFTALWPCLWPRCSLSIRFPTSVPATDVGFWPGLHELHDVEGQNLIDLEG
jgi:hypothetical protein